MYDTQTNKQTNKQTTAASRRTSKLAGILLCLTLLCIIISAPAAAADTPVTIEIGTNGKPTAASGTGWSYSSQTDTLILNRGYAFTLTGSACTATVNNYGTIVDGTFNGTVNNTSDEKNANFAGGTILYGTFYGEVVNSHGWRTCTIKDGTFYGKVSNQNHGVIAGGYFYGELDTYMLGNKVTGGNFAITFSLNGGTWSGEASAPSSYPYSASAAFPLPGVESVEKDGAAFDGWYDNAELSGNPVTAIPAKSSGKKTYYAKFVIGISTWDKMGETAVENTDYTGDAAGNYAIHTAKGLAWFANQVNGGNDFTGKTVTLTADIDLTSAGVLNYGKTTTTVRNSWIPITGFAGTFDGEKHRIQNLYVVTENKDAGLFDSNHGIIRNLEIESGSIVVNVDSILDLTPTLYAGSISAKSSGVVENCINHASVAIIGNTGKHLYIGGIVGFISTGSSEHAVPTIQNCDNYGAVTCTGEGVTNNIYCGGITGGASMTSLINECSNHGMITAKNGYSSYAGGIAGKVSTVELTAPPVEIRNSENQGDIVAESNIDELDHAGGIVGFSENNVIICNTFNWGTVIGEGNTGGIVGLNQKAVILNSYSSAELNKGTAIGGICGNNIKGTVTASYYLDSTASSPIGSGEPAVSSYAFTTAGTVPTVNSEENTELLQLLNRYVDAQEGTVLRYWMADGTNNNLPVFLEGELQKYTITYNPGAYSTAGSEQTAEKKQGIDVLLKPALFEREHHTQTGWTTRDGGTSEYPLNSWYGEDREITLYPAWAAHTYNITTYIMQTDGKSYTETTAVYPGTPGETVTADSTAPPGFSLNETSTLSGTVLADNSLTLEVRFDRNQYTLKTIVDGTEAAVLYYYEAPVTMPDEPTKTGYTFIGWDREIPAFMPAQDITVTALWEKNQDTPVTPSTPSKPGSPTVIIVPPAPVTPPEDDPVIEPDLPDEPDEPEQPGTKDDGCCCCLWWLLLLLPLVLLLLLLRGNLVYRILKRNAKEHDYEYERKQLKKTAKEIKRRIRDKEQYRGWRTDKALAKLLAADISHVLNLMEYPEELKDLSVHEIIKAARGKVNRYRL